MEKHKNNRQLRIEITDRAEKARALFQRSQALFKNAHLIEIEGGDKQEQSVMMKRSVELLEAAISETEEVCRLKKTLLNRQTQEIIQQKKDFL